MITNDWNRSKVLHCDQMAYMDNIFPSKCDNEFYIAEHRHVIYCQNLLYFAVYIFQNVVIPNSDMLQRW